MIVPTRKAWVVVPTYAIGSCRAYFDEATATAAAAELGPGMANVKEVVFGSQLNEVAREAHEMARAKGFWAGEAADVSKKLLLIHSEVTEAAEEVRSGNPLEHGSGTLPQSGPIKPEGLAPELADVLIRTLDLMHGLGIDVDDVVRRKMAYNNTRESRHGRKF